MSRYLQVGDESNEPLDLSSNSGWSQFIEWTDGLSRDDFSKLIDFADTGSATSPQEVHDDLAKAVVTSPPIPDVQSITQTLLSYLDGETEAISVT